MSSGYERGRFVDLSDQLAQDLTCGICRNIYEKAIINYCGHSFCRSCLLSYVRHRIPAGHQSHLGPPSCPECPQKIYLWLMIQPDKAVDNRVANAIVDKLRIKCSNAHNGCREVMAVEVLATHLDQCRYEVCKDCGLSVIPEEDHNCIELLKTEINHWKKVAEDRDLLDIKCKRHKQSVREFYGNFKGINQSNKSVDQLVAKLLSDTIEVDIESERQLHFSDVKSDTSETTPDTHMIHKRAKRS